jgi:hypothetical protein
MGWAGGNMGWAGGNMGWAGSYTLWAGGYETWVGGNMGWAGSTDDPIWAEAFLNLENTPSTTSGVGINNWVEVD